MESLDEMWKITGGADCRIVGHSGGADGINGNLDIFVDRGYIVAVLSNVDHGASPLADRIKGLIMRLK